MGALLASFPKDVGPLVFNHAVRKIQDWPPERVHEVGIEFDEAVFQQWRRRGPGVRAKRERCPRRGRGTAPRDGQLLHNFNGERPKASAMPPMAPSYA